MRSDCKSRNLLEEKIAIFWGKNPQICSEESTGRGPKCSPPPPSPVVELFTLTKMSTDMKKDNFFVCVEYMKLKCPAVARMENDDFIVKNIHNHPSARMRAKLIKKEVMNKTLSSSDVQPLRVLSDITAEVQRQDFAAVCFTRHTTCQRIKGSRQGCTSSTALSSTMRSTRKRQTFLMLLLVSRTGTYIHV